MKKKQAWKVMGAVLAGTLVFSDAVPLRASASAGTEKSAVQHETVSGTENGTETKTKRAAVYVNLKTGDDTADGTTAETAVKRAVQVKIFEFDFRLVHYYITKHRTSGHTLPSPGIQLFLINFS